MRRFSNWRFPFAVGFMLLVMMTFVTWSDSRSAYANERNLRKHEQAVNVAERKEASKERQLILRGQQDLQTKYDNLVKQNSALIEYLEGRNISIPKELRSTHTETKIEKEIERELSSNNGSISNDSSTPSTEVNDNSITDSVEDWTDNIDGMVDDTTDRIQNILDSPTEALTNE